MEKALRLRVKVLTEKLREETTDWSLYARRLEKEIVDGKRETVAELRGFYAAEHLVWQEASREAAVLWKRCEELVELLDRVRNSRHGRLLAQVDRLVDQLASDHPGAYTSMPHPFLAQKTFVISKKR